MPYPKWKYHRTELPVVVETPEEEDNLGEGWEESPVEPEAEPEPEAKPKGKKAKE